MVRAGWTAWFACKSACRCFVCDVAFVGAAGHSLCKDAALVSDLAELASQLRQLLSLSSSQRCTGLAATKSVGLRLTSPIADAALITTACFGRLNDLRPLITNATIYWRNGACIPVVFDSSLTPLTEQ